MKKEVKTIKYESKILKISHEVNNKTEMLISLGLFNIVLEVLANIVRQGIKILVKKRKIITIYNDMCIYLKKSKRVHFKTVTQRKLVQ